MKSHILSFILVFFFIQIVQAQEEQNQPDQAQKEKKSHLGVHVNTGISNQFFGDPELFKNSLSFRHGLGIDYFYHISSIVEFKTGISYSSQILNQSDLSLVFPCDFYPAGTDYPEGINYAYSRFDDRFNIHYIGIPIEFKFNLSKKSNRFYTKLGIESQFKLTHSIERELIECDLASRVVHSGQASIPSNFVTQTNFGVGIEFKLFKCTRMYLESQASYTINPIYKSSVGVNNSRLLNLGIVLGVKL